MRIERHPSRLNFRSRRRRPSGCLSLAVLIGLVAGIVTMSWNWFSQRLNVAAPRSTGANVDLNPAQAAFDRGDLDSAVNLAQQVLDAQPDNTAALTLLTRALIYRSYVDYNRAVDRESALQITGEALTRAPRNLDILAAHAFALQANGKPGQAAETAQRVLKDNPEHVLARVALALAYSGVGSHEVSLRESLRAIEAGNNVDALRTLALSYGGVGDFQNAIQSVEKAIALNNRLIPLHFERASYARQVGDVDTATVAYFQILTYDPQNAKARLRLCELSSLLRERDAAIDFCTQVTEIAPTWAEGWYHLGREYFLGGDFQQAQANLHRCSSLQIMQDVPVSERRFECWYLQGQAAEILGDCASLVTTYNEYRAMAADAGLRQTWLYPPEGPPGCVTPASGS